jgi:hypothetical protein
MVLSVAASQWPAVTVASVSGGDVGTWSFVKREQDTSGGYDAEVWAGTLSTTGPSTISVTLNGSAGVDLTAQEFSAGAGATWAVASSGAANASFQTAWAYPTLASSSPVQLYYGFASRGGSGTLSGRSTPAFTYLQSGLPDSDLVAYDPSANGTLSPGGADTSGSDYIETVAALFTATG